MQYIALLRGINVGGNNKVEMKKLKSMFELFGFTNISTYINSGNIIFESSKSKMAVQKLIETGFKKEFKFNIPTLVKTSAELKNIVKAIPKNWENSETHKTDVAYLFPEIDNKKIIDELPVKKEYIDIRYVKGALFWNVDRKNYNKSHINKIVGSRLYQYLTMRNVNTARYLANS